MGQHSLAIVPTAVIAPNPHGYMGDVIEDAAVLAYEALVDRGYSPADVHRQQVCYNAADIMVSAMTSEGFDARHEVHVGPEVGEHSYVSTGQRGVDEMIGDATWQQFLPPNRLSPNLPRVLIGTRGEVINQARLYGVGEHVLQLWSEHDPIIDPALLRETNSSAEAAADKAAADGKWAAFMSLK